MSVFSKIISGELPSYIVAQDENHLAFLDINPNVEGHTLVVPKKEQDKLFDLDKDAYLKLMNFSYRVAIALEKTVACKRIGMSVIGLEVPHVHIHLIPINQMDDMRFVKKKRCSHDEFFKLSKEISRNFI